MDRIPTSPPVIKPLPPSIYRPRWSVMIPVYNCSEYLAHTLESVLAQAFPEQDMQIEVVDDASNDADIETMVREIGKGRIGYYRQPQNVGSLRNFETCINRAQGHLVHLLHGDDRVKQGYYTVIEKLFEEHPKAGAAFCSYHLIDEKNRVLSNRPSSHTLQSGLLNNWLLRIGERQYIQYVTITVKREVYEKLGSFYGVTYGEDREMWVRIAKHYPVAYTSQVLAEYRKHTSSISANKHITGEYIDDLTVILKLIQYHIPNEHRKLILRKAKKIIAHNGIGVAYSVWQQHKNVNHVKTILRKIYRMHIDTMLIIKTIIMISKMILRR